MQRLIHWLRQLSQPPALERKRTVLAISESMAGHCEGCRCFVALSLTDDLCPNCGSPEFKYAILWQRTPMEQQAHQRQWKPYPSNRQEIESIPKVEQVRFVKALNGGEPKPLPRKTITVSGAIHD